MTQKVKEIIVEDIFDALIKKASNEITTEEYWQFVNRSKFDDLFR